MKKQNEQKVTNEKESTEGQQKTEFNIPLEILNLIEKSLIIDDCQELILNKIFQFAQANGYDEDQLFEAGAEMLYKSVVSDVEETLAPDVGE